MVSISYKQVNWRGFRLGKQFPIVAARFVTVCFLLLLVWALGRIAWIWVTPDTSMPVTVIPQTTTTSQNKADSYQISQLLSQNFFGEYKATNSLKQEVAINAPKTKLNLTLVGVVASSNPSQALAVIANGGTQQIYTIGETIKSSQAVLRQVMSDRIVLRNNGRDEVLMLDGVDFEAIVPSKSAKTAGGKSSAVDPLASMKADIMKNPQSLLKYITLSQQKNDKGEVIGYRIGPGSDRRFFDDAGLQAGDIVTEINGIDLKNPSEMAKIWSTLSSANEINLTVMRNGQEQKLYIGL